LASVIGGEELESIVLLGNKRDFDDMTLSDKVMFRELPGDSEDLRGN